MGISVICGDSLSALASLLDDSIDALVTDPPAGVSFMGRAWDNDKGGRDQWIAWLASIMRECLRVMKPGAHGLVWALPRTSHWTATALEDAGFEIRDVVTHLFGSGFPKSLNAARAIDETLGFKGGAGAPRSAAHAAWIERGAMRGGEGDAGWQRPWMDDAAAVEAAAVEAAARTYLPASDEAKKYDGWGTALKPASEHWILIRKPLSEGSVAKNVLRWGTGALNIDASRIGPEGVLRTTGDIRERNDGYGMNGGIIGGSASGRWPANVVLSHEFGCKEVPLEEDPAALSLFEMNAPSVNVTREGEESADRRYTKEDGAFAMTPGARRKDGSPATKWECEPGCPVRLLDRQSGERPGCQVPSGAVGPESIFLPGQGGYARQGPIYPDTGGASRYFYTAKPDKTEKDAGCDALEAKPVKRMEGGAMLDGKHNPENGPDRFTPIARNSHPTVKPVALMAYFVKMVTPPGGTVLDPFAGSGTTLVACVREGFDAIGIEREEEYAAIIRARVADAENRVVS